MTERGGLRTRWEAKEETHSPTVMDSGRAGVGSAVESGAGGAGGLDSILEPAEETGISRLGFVDSSRNASRFL